MATPKLIRFTVLWLALSAALGLAFSRTGVTQAHGGGYPQITNTPAGPYVVTVWTQPQPLRVGEAHFSVAVSQPVSEGAGIALLDLDATVELELVSDSGGQPVKLTASRDNAVNKLYYETDVDLTETGQWHITVFVAGEAGSGSTDFSVEVLPAAPNTLWILWASMGVLAVTMLWGTRAYQNGVDLRKIVPVVGTVLILTPVGAGLLARALRPPTDASVSSFNWPAILSGEPDLVINVVASQWQWQFEYPASGITTTKLMLPKGLSVQLNLTSTDVIHTFGIPEFALSEDIMPGATTSVRITPARVGHYKVICEAFCGIDYQDMLAEITVSEPDDFETWLTQQKAK